jgi:hypothetical protein
MSRRLCYRPTVFCRQLHLIALSFPQGRIWRVSKILLSKFFFTFFLKKKLPYVWDYVDRTSLIRGQFLLLLSFFIHFYVYKALSVA